MLEKIKEIEFTKDEFWALYQLMSGIKNAKPNLNLHSKNIQNLSVSIEIDKNNYRVVVSDISKLGLPE